MRNTIILEDYSLVFVLKEPRDCFADALPATMVDVGIKFFDTARPINLNLDGSSNTSDRLNLCSLIMARAIACDIDTARRSGAYCCNNFFERVGAFPRN